jgi:hypothetical protein
MKKIVPVLLILVVPVLAAAASAPDSANVVQTSSAVQIPDALKNILSGLILAGVMLGLQVVFDWIGLDLRGVGAALAVAISGFAIAEIQGYIDAIPVVYDYLLTIGLNVLVVILTGLGYLRLLVNRERAVAMLRP